MLFLICSTAGVAQHFTPWRHHVPEYGDAAGRQQGLCEQGSVMVGIYGRSGTLIDSVNGVLCMGVMADGQWRGPTPYRREYNQARYGGRDFTLACPPGQGVRGIAGRAGTREPNDPTATWMDALTLLCGPLGLNAQGRIAVVGQGASVGPVGGNGGEPFSDVCPAGTLGWVIETLHQPRTGDSRFLFYSRLGCSIGMGQPYDVQSLTLSKNAIVPGESATVTVTLRGPAGAEDKRVLHAPRHLPPMSTMFVGPPGWEITIPPGQTSASATITAAPTAQPGQRMDISPSSSVGWGQMPSSPTHTLTVRYPNVSFVKSVSVNPAVFYEGGSTTLTVALEGPPRTSGTNVPITLSGPAWLNGPVSAAGTPNILLFSGNITSQTVSLTYNSGLGTGSILAKTNEFGDSGQLAQYTILPNAVKSVVWGVQKDSRGQGGGRIGSAGDGPAIIGTVTLEVPAVGGPRTVNLSVSDPRIAGVPESVQVPAGASIATFPIKVAKGSHKVAIRAAIVGPGSGVIREALIVTDQ